MNDAEQNELKFKKK